MNKNSKRLILYAESGQPLMVCPRCEKAKDILAYFCMGQIKDYELETAPIYKCPSCSWIFAPVDSPFDIGKL